MARSRQRAWNRKRVLVYCSWFFIIVLVLQIQFTDSQNFHTFALRRCLAGSATILHLIWARECLP